MKNSQLEKMSVSDLRELQGRLADAIADCQKRERVELKDKMEAMATKAGLSLDEVFGRRGRNGKRGPAAVKFRNPNDPTQTWTGRGRKPLWLGQAGGNIERFRVS